MSGSPIVRGPTLALRTYPAPIPLARVDEVVAVVAAQIGERNERHSG